MGFPYAFLRIPRSISLDFIPKSLCFFKAMFIAALTHLGLLKQLQQGTNEDNNIDNNYVLPSVKDLIKTKLGVKKFGDVEDKECVCLVCLESLMNTDEIRELCNCRHVFHRECLDSWVDKGHVTCPVCRSMLFPDNLSTAERNALLICR